MIESLLTVALVAQFAVDQSRTDALARVAVIDGPTVEEVRAVVLDYLGDDDKQSRAKGLLEEWGDSALPALRVLANESFGTSEGLRIVFSVDHVTTQASTDLLVEILASKTNVDAGYALSQIRRCKSNGVLRRYLRRNEEFKDVAFRFVEDSSWLNRGSFADIAAAMKWKDAVPLLEKMLEDENQNLRISAAKALTKLTGESVIARRHEASFPTERLVPGLVGSPKMLPQDWSKIGAFTRDLEGKPRLFICGKGGLVGLGDNDRSALLIATEHSCYGALAFPGAESIEFWVTLASDKTAGGVGYVSAVDSDGKVLWSHRPAESGVADVTLLYTAKGVDGVAIACESKLVAVSHEGAILWKREQFTPAYEVLSHPELPGVMYTVFGSCQRFDVSRDGFELSPGITEFDVDLYATHAELFPDQSGHPALVAAGSGSESVPMVIRFDENGRVFWTAILPGRIEDLAMLEAADHPRLFVVTADTGEFFVLDDQGALLHKGAFPGDHQNEFRPTYCLSVGEISPGKWALLLSCLEGSFVYPIDLSVL